MLRLILAPVFVYGWSDAGHYFSAQIANIVMKHSTRFWVHSQIGGSDLDSALRAASVWADHDGRSDETDEYHFVHTAYRQCLPYVAERDCGFRGSGKCLVTGLMRYYREAIDEEGSIKDRAVALKMLIHLLADLFQPLHTGFAEDHGGNDIALMNEDANGNTVSLHEYWDRVLTWDIDKESREMTRKEILGRVSQERFVKTIPDEANDIYSWLTAVVSHNSRTNSCGFAYKDTLGAWVESGHTLPDPYMETARKRTVQLLMGSGVTIARVLDQLAGVWLERTKAKIERVDTNLIATDTNPFSSLVIEDFDFHPDEVFAVSADEPALPRGSHTSSPDGGIQLVKSKTGEACITTRARSRIVRTEFVAVMTFEVEFPRNTKANRVVKLVLDSGAFPFEQSHNTDFVLSLIYRLRGRKYMGSTVVPAGRAAPGLRVVLNIFRDVDIPKEGERDTLSVESHFGSILAVPRVVAQTSGEVRMVVAVPDMASIPSAHDQRKSQIRRTIAATYFPTESDQLKEYSDKVVIPKRCSQVFLAEIADKMTFITTLSAMRVSASLPGSPIRAWGSSVTFNGGSPVLLLIDQNALEDAPTQDSQDLLMQCGEKYTKTNAYEALRTRRTILYELDQIYSAVTREPKMFPKSRTVANDIFMYRTMDLRSDAMFVFEWKLIT
jgi:hypothetical protein